MNKELEQEIKDSQNLSRRERRKKEIELQKKYKDKSIRIKLGKSFNKSQSLTRKQKRELMSDKNFLEEIIKIIKKYFPQLERMISELTDKRNKSYITYNMKTIIFTKLITLICGITTMAGINDSFNTEETIKNLSIICRQPLKEVPDWMLLNN